MSYPDDQMKRLLGNFKPPQFSKHEPVNFDSLPDELPTVTFAREQTEHLATLTDLAKQSAADSEKAIRIARYNRIFALVSAVAAIIAAIAAVAALILS